jgi:hypothetical protein
MNLEHFWLCCTWSVGFSKYSEVITVYLLHRYKFIAGENKPKNYLQLTGRVLLAFMFVTLLRFEASVLQASKQFRNYNYKLLRYVQNFEIYCIVS